MAIPAGLLTNAKAKKTGKAKPKKNSKAEEPAGGSSQKETVNKGTTSRSKAWNTPFDNVMKILAVVCFFFALRFTGWVRRTL